MEKGPAIIRMGTFDKYGTPIGWHFGGDDIPTILEVKNGEVRIAGVLMVQMTADRKKLMAEAQRAGGC